MLDEQQQEMVDAAAELLYGLVHARYVLTGKGLSAVVRGRRRRQARAARARAPLLRAPTLALSRLPAAAV